MSEPQTTEEYARDGRIGRILNEYLDRRAAGQAEPEAELLARHPDLADYLRSHLEMLRELAPDRSKIEALVAQGVLQKSADPRYAAEFGSYQITGWIGRGGMGIVLGAYEESLDRTVALKILKPELVEDEAAVARFAREAKAAAGLRHPNIITVHAVGQERDAHFLAMEYIDGPTLGQLIRQRGPLPTETIRGFFGEILSALACAHEAGLIHRDIKSSNILLDEPRTSARADVRHGQAELGCGATSQSPIPNPQSAIVKLADFGGWHGQAKLGRGDQPSSSTTGKNQPVCQSTRSLPMPPDDTLNPELATLNSCTVKLADFGLARMLSARTRMTTTGSVLGTPEYMSPEQARGDAELDHRTDLYSAGVVLYEMLTGRTPFKADTPSAVIHRILHDEPTDPRTITHTADPHLASLALRLMAKRPEDRFDSASDALAALRAGERIRSPEKRRRLARRIVVGVCAIALLAAGVWALSQLAKQSAPSSAAPEVKPPITRVWVDQNVETRILAEYGDDPAAKKFHEFPPAARCVTGLVLLDLDGSGRRAVVAGVAHPLNGECVFGFNPAGQQVWALDMSSRRQWPDCALPAKFGCRYLAAGNLDGRPGEELVVAADQIDEYPAGLSIVAPRTQEVGPTFWHMGQIGQILLAPDFFGPGQPAIIARGSNNKLDGFYEELPGDKEALTPWDIVHVLMILDPKDMDGLGPPPCEHRIPDINPVQPWAYAFLHLSPSEDVPDVSEGQANPRFPEVDEVASIANIFIEACPAGDHGNHCIRLPIQTPKPRERSALMSIDSRLELVRIVQGDEHFWQRHWRPIIQNGEYVNEAAGWADRSTPPP